MTSLQSSMCAYFSESMIGDVNIFYQPEDEARRSGEVEIMIAGKNELKTAFEQHCKPPQSIKMCVITKNICHKQ